MIARRCRSAAEAADREAEAAASPEIQEDADPVPITAEIGSQGLFDRTADEDQSSPAVTDLAAAAARARSGPAAGARENGSAVDAPHPPGHRTEEPSLAGDGRPSDS